MANRDTILATNLNTFLPLTPKELGGARRDPVKAGHSEAREAAEVLAASSAGDERRRGSHPHTITGAGCCEVPEGDF